MNTDPLSQLRDVILPPDPGTWPPAFGWWLLLILVVVGLIGLVYLARFIYRKLKNASLEDRIDALTHLQPQEAIVELSILMRRIAITKYSRATVAGLSGEAWLNFLDESGKTDQFTCGAGRVLASAPYRAAIPDQLDSLFEVCRNWTKTVASQG